jgi:phosphoglycolate phosphatase-like HAD superfamily hydrolase
MSLQRSAANPSTPPAVPPIVHDVLRSSGQPINTGIRTLMEPRFGHDFSNVRVHTDAMAAESARSVNALAYTVGRDVVFGSGQYTPDSTTGKQLIAHELTHVVQQQSPTSVGGLQLAGGPSNEPFEREANNAAKSILQPMSSASKFGSFSKSPAGLYCKVDEISEPVQSRPQPPVTSQVSEQQRTLIEQLKKEAHIDAVRIKELLQDTNWRGSLSDENQDSIIAIAEKWASKPPTGIKLTPFDYFVVGLSGVIFEIGFIVKQSTSSFDRLFNLMDDDHVARFKQLMQNNANIFRGDKPLEEVKFEITKEDLKRGLKVAKLGVEIVAAVATGGGSVLAQVLYWLAYTLPDLYEKAKSIIGFVNAIRNLRLDDVKKLITASGLGDLLVKALFHEVQGLPQIAQEEKGEQEAENEPAEGKKGLFFFLQTIMNVFNTLKKVYAKVAEFVNKAIASIDITQYEWFIPFSIAYASVVDLLEAIHNPGAVLGIAVSKIRETVSNFFKGIREKVEGTAEEIKSKVELIGKPAELLHLLADRAVEWVLNFIITHPPSEIIAIAFGHIQELAGESLIQLVREKVPFADKIIKYIAESSTVEKILHPLQEPIKGATDAITNVSGQATGMINTVEGRVEAFMGDGVQMVKELSGLNPEHPETGAKIETEGASPEQTQTQEQTRPTSSTQAQGQTQAPTDFLSVIKHGIHAHLLAIGRSHRGTKIKELATSAKEKLATGAKSIAGKVKGILLGSPLGFEVRGEHHQLWAEEQNNKVEILVSSDEREEIAQKLKDYKSILEILSRYPNAADTHNQAESLIKELERLYIKASSVAPKDVKTLAPIEQAMVPVVEHLDILLPSIKRFPPKSGFRKHHVMPRQFDDEFAKKMGFTLKSINIDIDEWAVQITHEDHVGAHNAGWNPEWMGFLKKLDKKMPREQIKDEILKFKEVMKHGPIAKDFNIEKEPYRRY